MKQIRYVLYYSIIHLKLRSVYAISYPAVYSRIKESLRHNSLFKDNNDHMKASRREYSTYRTGMTRSGRMKAT